MAILVLPAAPLTPILLLFASQHNIRACRPAIFDIAAASVYIALSLQPWIAVIVFVTLRCECTITWSYSLIAYVLSCPALPLLRGIASPQCTRCHGYALVSLIPAFVPTPCSGYIPMTIYLTEWRGKYRR